MRTPIALALAASLSTSAAPAKEREGVVAPPGITVEGKPLQLAGVGLRKKLFFKVYLASLYLEELDDDAAKVI